MQLITVNIKKTKEFIHSKNSPKIFTKLILINLVQIFLFFLVNLILLILLSNKFLDTKSKQLAN